MGTIDNTNLTSPAALTSSVKDNYLDQNSLNSVKAMGRHNDPKALKEIAKKFEAMFVQQMLKSMRDANEVFAEGDMFSSEEVKFHQDMLDQQMVLNLTSGEGIGLAKSMYQQMEKMYGKKSAVSEEGEADALKNSAVNQLQSIKATKPLTSRSAVGEAPPLISRTGIKSAIAKTPEEFVATVRPYAEKAAAELNINPDVLLAQAALETGWGKHLLHDTQGNNSFNMFNIKANAGWQGKSVGVNSLEYKQGVTQQERSEFRQYDNYLQSFTDYVNLIKNNPRYQQVMAAGSDSAGYADALQKTGYATDPQYADKIKRLLSHDSIRSAVDSAAVPTTSAVTGDQS
jgi:flagellar protein FlgJ